MDAQTKHRPLPVDYMPAIRERPDRFVAEAMVGTLHLEIGAIKPLTNKKREQLRYAVWHASEYWRLKQGQPV